MQPLNKSEYQIQKALWRKFIHHQYRFINIFFFDSEQDYLTFLPNGYCWEIEIKISRSDYRADFKKPKHQHYANLLHQVNHQAQKGSEHWLPMGIEYNEALHGNIETNRSRYAPYNLRSQFERELLSWQHTKIIFKDVSTTPAPNKFYYAAPKGLLRINDIPDHAGLIEISSTGITTIVKKAPFLHKGLSDPKTKFQTVYNRYQSSIHTYLFRQH